MHLVFVRWWEAVASDAPPCLLNTAIFEQYGSWGLEYK